MRRHAGLVRWERVRELGERIKLEPDESGRFLWAEYSLGLTALLPNAEIMVAGPACGVVCCGCHGAERGSGGRYELCSTYAVLVWTVPASIAATR